MLLAPDATETLWQNQHVVDSGIFPAGGKRQISTVACEDHPSRGIIKYLSLVNISSAEMLPPATAQLVTQHINTR